MSLLRNQVTMVGLLGNDAAITTYENGAMVARFSIEVESRKSTEESKRSPMYRMFAWGNTAAFVNQFCRKGSRLAITGRLVNRTFLDKKGQLQRITEIEVRQVVKF
ncbi:MAG: single-stranded DNA-binding protein [Fluviicola sp.]|nr:single-stranded DNA-binding protein [Fluviicola sp.]